MRKRAQYRRARGRLQVKVPTLVIMVLALFCILYFGNTISDRIAEIFVPAESPVTDDVAAGDPAAAVDVPTGGAAPDVVTVPEGTVAGIAAPGAGMMKSGTIVAQANKDAARHILQILSRGTGVRADSRPEGAGGTP